MEFITSIWNTLICIFGTVGIGIWYIMESVKEWKQNRTKIMQELDKI